MNSPEELLEPTIEDPLPSRPTTSEGFEKVDQAFLEMTTAQLGYDDRTRKFVAAAFTWHKTTPPEEREKLYRDRKIQSRSTNPYVRTVKAAVSRHNREYHRPSVTMWAQALLVVDRQELKPEVDEIVEWLNVPFKGHTGIGKTKLIYRTLHEAEIERKKRVARTTQKDPKMVDENMENVRSSGSDIVPASEKMKNLAGHKVLALVEIDENGQPRDFRPLTEDVQVIEEAIELCNKAHQNTPANSSTPTWH